MARRFGWGRAETETTPLFDLADWAALIVTAENEDKGRG